jgi:DeoR family transcriptional regulator, aga operon transcriptional repressor
MAGNPLDAELATQPAKSDRFGAILEQLAGEGSVRVAEIAQRLRVSTATIRRDLEELEGRHMLTRTHGGAVGRSVVYELPMRYKSTARVAEKRRIAAAAAALVPDGAVIGLTGGTTTTEVARALVERSSLTVVTNALNIGWELAVHPNLKLVLTGGVARTQSYELNGPLAESTLARVNLDLVFLGVDGVDVEHGLTTHHEVEAHTNRVMIERGRRVVVVADHTKLGQVRFAQIAPLDLAHQLITDEGGDEAMLAELRRAGFKVTLV